MDIPEPMFLRFLIACAAGLLIWLLIQAIGQASEWNRTDDPAWLERNREGGDDDGQEDS